MADIAWRRELLAALQRALDDRFDLMEARAMLGLEPPPESPIAPLERPPIIVLPYRDTAGTVWQVRVERAAAERMQAVIAEILEVLNVRFPGGEVQIFLVGWPNAATLRAWLSESFLPVLRGAGGGVLPGFVYDIRYAVNEARPQQGPARLTIQQRVEPGQGLIPELCAVRMPGFIYDAQWPAPQWRTEYLVTPGCECALCRDPAASRASQAIAKTRARALLLRFLSPAQREEYERDRRFTLVTPGGSRWQLGGTYAQRLERDYTTSYCIGPDDSVPLEDKVLAQKLLLETNEARFLQIANRV